MTLNATNELEIVGSDVGSANTLTVNANNINIHASENTYSTETESESKNANVGLYGTNMGQATVGYQENEMTTSGTTQRNSQLYAGGTANITSTGDTTLSGANIEARTLALNVGGDLTMQSLQDTQTIEGKSKGGSISGSVVAMTPTGASANSGETSGQRAWVNQATNINGQESIKVTVGGTTTLKGASITNVDTDGKGKGNLNLTTQNLVVNDIKDIDTFESTTVGVGVGATKDKPKLNSVDYTNNTKDKEQITRATIGSGTINTGSATATVNRDISKIQEITKDESSNTELYVSNRTLELLDDPTKAIANLGDKLGDVGLASHVEILENLPSTSKDGDGNGDLIDSTIGAVLDTLGDATGGAIPNAANDGGYVTQIATQLFGDNRNQIILKDEQPLKDLELDSRYDENGNERSDWDYEQHTTVDGSVVYRTNPDRAVRIEEEREYDENGEDTDPLKDHKIHISSRDIQTLGIQHVFTNGMNNTNNEAINNQQSQQGNADAILNFNPSHGGIADMLQNAQDHVVGTLPGVLGLEGAGHLGTGSAYQTGEVINQVTQANNGDVTISSHSQGTMMTQNGMDIEQSDISNVVQGNEDSQFLVQYSGAPVGDETAANLVRDIYGGSAGIEAHFGEGENSIGNVFRSHSNPGDPVSTILGGNSAGVNSSDNYLENLGYTITRGVPTIANGMGEKDQNGNWIKNPSPHSGYPCLIGCGNERITPGDTDLYFDPNQNSERPLSEFYGEINVDTSQASFSTQTSASTSLTQVVELKGNLNGKK